MSDAVPQPIDPDDVTNLPASYMLGEAGWEETDYVEPGPDWRMADDGTFESPDGHVRTKVVADAAEWSDAVRPRDR